MHDARVSATVTVIGRDKYLESEYNLQKKKRLSRLHTVLRDWISRSTPSAYSFINPISSS